jgi:hypothetical protein
MFTWYFLPRLTAFICFLLLMCYIIGSLWMLWGIVALAWLYDQWAKQHWPQQTAWYETPTAQFMADKAEDIRSKV